jgi:hypothetical protein
MNTILLEQFQNQSTDVKNQIDQFRKIPVQLSKINKSGRVFLYEGQQVRTSALNDLLNFFSVKNDLLREIHDDEKQWLPLQRCLSNIKNDRIITGITKQEGDNKVITKFLKEEIKEESPLNMNHGLNLLQGYIEIASENVKLHNFRFNEENLAMESSFRDLSNQIDIFGDSKDMWDSGFSFVYGLNKTTVSPFLLRLICSNGMMATHQVSQRYFSNKGLRQKSFNRLINKTLSNDLRVTAIQSCERMKHNNASLREFFNARDTCLSISKELADVYFNDEQIQEAYKPYKLRYKNSRWLSSANSNINSYEFFNRLTHCVSHQKGLPQWAGMQLNHQASEIFFKGPDLSFQAPNPFLN